MKSDAFEIHKPSLEHQLNGHRLTTAHILYHLPDYPEILQEFIWQHLDIAPQFPRLTAFLDFWQGKIDGKLHSVTIASCKTITPARYDVADAAFVLH